MADFFFLFSVLVSLAYSYFLLAVSGFIFTGFAAILVIQFVLYLREKKYAVLYILSVLVNFGVGIFASYIKNL